MGDRDTLDNVVLFPPPVTVDHPEETVKRKWRPTVEPLIFIVSLAAFTNVTIQNFFLQRICEHEYNNGTVVDLNGFCKHLQHYKEQEAHVQKIFGIYSTYRMFITTGPPLILALFWGELNDRWGSKRMLFIPLVGYILSNCFFFVLTFFEASHPAFLLIALLPEAMCGGTVALTISLFKLVVNTSTPEERTFRIGVAEGAMLIGNPIGLLFGAKILDSSGFGVVFILGACIYILAIFAGVIFVVDDGPAVRSVSTEPSSTRCWSLNRFRESVQVFGPNKMLLFLIILIPSIRTFVMGGNGAVMLPFTRYKFDWDQLAFSTFSTFGGVLSALGLLIVSTIALKILHVPDALLGAISALSFATGCSVWAFATKPWFMYLGSAIQLCQGISIIIVRSMISRLCRPEDVGKALSILSIPENLMPFISTPVYNAIYISTLSNFIGIVFLLSAALNGVVVIAFSYIYAFLPPASPQPQLYVDESDQPHDETDDDEGSDIQ